eukprot:SAG11_NODE_168_length_13643_cov_5.436651_2_plen_179_part_00
MYSCMYTDVEKLRAAVAAVLQHLGREVAQGEETTARTTTSATTATTASGAPAGTAARPAASVTPAGTQTATPAPSVPPSVAQPPPMPPPPAVPTRMQAARAEVVILRTRRRQSENWAAEWLLGQDGAYLRQPSKPNPTDLGPTHSTHKEKYICHCTECTPTMASRAIEPALGVRGRTQ